jgi:hypothetical protein
MYIYMYSNCLSRVEIEEGFNDDKVYIFIYIYIHRMNGNLISVSKVYMYIYVYVFIYMYIHICVYSNYITRVKIEGLNDDKVYIYVHEMNGAVSSSVSRVYICIYMYAYIVITYLELKLKRA